MYLRCAEGFFFNGPPVDEVVADMITESGRLRDLDGSSLGNRHFRFDEVFNPVSLAGGNVSG